MPHGPRAVRTASLLTAAVLARGRPAAGRLLRRRIRLQQQRRARPECPGPDVQPGEPQAAARPARSGRTTALTLAAPSIIDTASLTVRARSVAAAAARAAAIAAAAGGYVSSQRETVRPGQHAVAAARLQLKIPVTAYPAVLTTLSARLGTLISISRQATDVTQQVADVSSRVTSAQAAIVQLRALLRRAGSVSDLLSVQDQINAQEAALEALQAQQRALAGQTAYATVTLSLVSPHPKAAAPHKKSTRRGFLAGLSGGWRALRLVVSGLLTGLGAAAPFLAVAAVVAGLGYAARRRLLRRRSGPTAAA